MPEAAEYKPSSIELLVLLEPGLRVGAVQPGVSFVVTLCCRQLRVVL
jgi:hypothetical protein